jgi:hypothetical protein
MFEADLLLANILSPAVICFIVGAVAAFLKSDLHVPPQVHETISMFLLFAIGLKGGIALSETTFSIMAMPLLATLVLGVITPLMAYLVAKYIGRLDTTNAGGIAAHYGSVSAVTFMAAVNFASLSAIPHEGFLTALLVVLEIPGIVIALIITKLSLSKSEISLGAIIREALTGKSVVLMVGGLLVGLLADQNGIDAVSHVFVTPFQGVLAFFLLEIGVVAASRLRETTIPLGFIVLFGTIMPLIFGALGIFAGHYAGLSVGGAAILGTMAASASYIAAPAAVKMALPEANPAIYLTASISITLPFNIAIGIPLYFMMSGWV